MYQLTQQLKSGKMQIIEVPFPTMGKEMILVRNHYSVISIGTERKTVADARKGYFGKAKSRKKNVQHVIQMIKAQGFRETYKMVKNKLEALSSLGYSCAGEVIAVGEKIHEFRVGDLVACGGNSAVHADVISVSENLCVKVSKETDLQQAAFTTIASIAIQGIRQSDLRFGESCMVIGMGLIGQLTCLILESTGIKCIGLDISEIQVSHSKQLGIKYVYTRSMPGLHGIISNHTDGHGTDAVIITAATTSMDPVNFAGEICRKKGKVVIVGAVPTGFEREHYYKKELELRMSSSYGPGRYDPDYEEKGKDYPIAYVRWTENRNMQAFINLLEQKKLDISKLITHVFELEKAPKAYQMILERSEPFSGILIQYAVGNKLEKDVLIKEISFTPEEPNVGWIGAGSFAQNILLPRAKGLCNFIGVSSAFGNESKYIAVKYNFNYCTGDSDKIINDKAINTLIITTRHNLHAPFIIKGLKAGKNVFVEKPLAMSTDELEEIRKTYYSVSSTKNIPRLMIGFNRRFSPSVLEIKKSLSLELPKAINMRINAGQLAKDHWVNDPNVGGGRIIGEVVHFIDLAYFIADSEIKTVSAQKMDSPENLCDTLAITLSFRNGSIANISYFSNGSKRLPKEYIEVFSGKSTFIIKDFKRLEIWHNRKTIKKYKGQDKGHRNELIRFFDSIRNGDPSPIPFEELYHSTLATFKIIESIQQNRTIVF